MVDLSVGRSPVAPNAGINKEQAAEIARQGRVGNRRVSTQGIGPVGPIRGQVDNATVATPVSDRSVGLVPDNPALGSISWFTERLPGDTKPGGMQRGSFSLAFGSESLADDMRNVVSFAQQIDRDILRASELLEKSEHKPLNKMEQREVNILLNAGKYNLAQVKLWTAVTRDELEGFPAAREFMAKMQERLVDRHMDLADLMCLYDIDQVPPEQAVSRADRIGYDLVAADAALKVAGGLTVPGLSGEAKQQLVEVLEDHRAVLGQAKDAAIGGDSDSDSARVLSKAVWGTSFNLIKGKTAGNRFVSDLHQHWDAKAAGEATGSWLPLARYKLTQGQMLQEFVGYQLKQAGVAKKNMPDLKFQFKEATNRALNERTWKPIEKELHYSVAGKSRTVHSKITPAKAMAGRRFAEGIPANGVNCSDRMQYTHVPNLARTELTDESGKTLFSALRHGVLDAYDISASSLRKLPEQALVTMVKDLLVPRNTKNDGAPPLPPGFEDGAPPLPPGFEDGAPPLPPRFEDGAPPLPGFEDGVGSIVAGSGADATIQKTDNNPIAYSGKFGDTCPEECAVFVANHFKLECKFETYKNTGQIDITLPLSINAPEPERGSNRPMLFTDGKRAESCFDYLQGLDKGSIYLMRTGQNDLAGHNQILYSKDNEWHAYDSAASQSQLTFSGSLTAAGSDKMVKSFATWGVKYGESSISTVQVTKQGARALIGFIKDCRNKDEATAIANLYAEQPPSDADIDHDSQVRQQMQQQMQKIASESSYIDMGNLGGDVRVDSAGKAAGADPAVVLSYGDSDYATIKRTRPPEVPASYGDDVWESTLDAKELLTGFLSDPEGLHTLDAKEVLAEFLSDPEELHTLDAKEVLAEFLSDPEELPGAGAATSRDMAPGEIDAHDPDREQRVSQIVDAIRTNPTQAAKYASEMRTVASQNMAEELAVAALVGDPDKLRAALDGAVVDLTLSSISLLTPDRLRSNPKSNERQMLRRQTEALQNLDSRFGGRTRLQVRNAEGELRTVEVNCKVRTFNFGVNAGAVGRAKMIPSHLRGWDKLMGWGYAMKRNDPQLRTLLGDPKSATLGGEVQDKLTGLEGKITGLQTDLRVLNYGTLTDGSYSVATIPKLRRDSVATITKLRRELVATTRNMNTLREAAADAKKIWREGSYNKGGQDPYKMVSRLGIVINEMGETLTFNCKSGKDRTGQLDAELKYLTTLSAAGHLPAPGAPATPELRQMRSDFTLNSGNLEMQRMNTGLPGFKLKIKGVPGLANFIAGPEMEPVYRGGSDYIKS